MNKLHKFLLILCASCVIIPKTLCDDTIELHCTSDQDCKSFEDKFISSKCNKTCICLDRTQGNAVTCSPKNTKVTNTLTCPCNLPNTECKDEKCVCRDGFIMSKDNINCIAKSVQLGKPCESSEQCARSEKNSACIKDVCGCAENFIEVENSCRSLMKAANACNENKTCEGNSECIKDDCVCQKNFIFSSNKATCLALAHYNDTCEEHIQCEMGLGEGSICEGKKCICKSNYSVGKVNEKDICQRNIFSGDLCKQNSDCNADGEQKMSCKDGKCICSEGFETDDQKKCIESARFTSGSSSLNALSFVIILALIASVLCF